MAGLAGLADGGCWSGAEREGDGVRCVRTRKVGGTGQDSKGQEKFSTILSDPVDGVLSCTARRTKSMEHRWSPSGLRFTGGCCRRRDARSPGKGLSLASLPPRSPWLCLHVHIQYGKSNPDAFRRRLRFPPSQSPLAFLLGHQQHRTSPNNRFPHPVVGRPVHEQASLSLPMAFRFPPWMASTNRLESELQA